MLMGSQAWPEVPVSLTLGSGQDSDAAHWPAALGQGDSSFSSSLRGGKTAYGGGQCLYVCIQHTLLVLTPMPTLPLDHTNYI